MKNISLIILSIFFSNYLSAQLFTQDFSSSTDLNTYFSATPSANQFNYIAAASSAGQTTIGISGNKLLFTRTSSVAATNNYAAAVRSSRYNPAPNFAKISFELSLLSFTTQASSDGVRLYLGGCQLADNSVPATTNLPYAWLRIQPVTGGTQIKILDGAATFASTTFTGTQTITWILNNTGATESYTGPDGANYLLANDQYDLWYGTTRGISARNVNKADSTMNSFKIITVAGAFSVAIDNLEITDLQSPLPVKLISFYAKQFHKQVQLQWSTANEINNSHFIIERSTDGKNFIAIGNVEGAGNSSNLQNYSLVDEHPVQNTVNYYRLKQTDFDGAHAYSSITAVDFIQKEDARLISVNALHTNAQIYNPEETQASLFIYDISGRLIYTKEYELLQGNNQLYFPEALLTQGLYVLHIKNEAGLFLTGKFIR
jgi:hypothetical protein